jgi:hypothetical protein
MKTYPIWGVSLLLYTLFGVSSCRTDKPPAIEVCILDGFGGGKCVESDGTELYKSPSAMKDYWATNEPDMGNYTSWCYQTSAASVQPSLLRVKQQVAQIAPETRVP